MTISIDPDTHNLSIEARLPHEAFVDAHSIAGHHFNLTIGCVDRWLNRIKQRGSYPINYISAYLTREEATALRDKLTEFLEENGG